MSKKVVAITGASRGIGAEISTHLSSLGMHVYACARSESDLPPSVNTSVLDITQENSVKTWLKEILKKESRIDMLINNAGVLGKRCSFQEIDSNTWQKVINTNIVGTLLITKAFIPTMAKSTPSTILNISSIIGKFGRAGWSTYAVSKFAIEGLTQVLAQELCSSGIRVLSLHPSRISTDLRESAYGSKEHIPDSETNKKNLLDSITWLLNNPDVPLTGISLSSNDFAYWSNCSIK